MQDIRSGDQYPQGGVGGQEEAVVTIQQSIGRGCHISIKLDVPKIPIFVGSVPLMTDGFQREGGASGLV